MTCLYDVSWFLEVFNPKSNDGKYSQKGSELFQIVGIHGSGYSVCLCIELRAAQLHRVKVENEASHLAVRIPQIIIVKLSVSEHLLVAVFEFEIIDYVFKLPLGQSYDLLLVLLIHIFHTALQLS